MAEPRRIIRIVGSDLEYDQQVATPIVAAITNDKGDGVEITEVVYENNPDFDPAHPEALATRAIIDSVNRGETPIISLTAHGSNYGDGGAHTFSGLMPGLNGNTHALSVDAIEAMVKAYRDAYHAKYGPNSEPPKVLIEVSSCYAEGILKNLPPSVLEQADILLGDSQEKITFQGDSGSILQSLARGKTPQETFLRSLMIDSTYSIPALATSEGVLDGDDLARLVTPANFEQSKATALANIASLPPAIQALARTEIEKLTPDTFAAPVNECRRALLGYLANEDHRFTPLSDYAKTAVPIAQFLDSATPPQQLRAIAGSLDENNRTMLFTHLGGVVSGFPNRPFTPEQLNPRLLALAEAGTNILSGQYAARLQLLGPLASRYVNASDKDGFTPLMLASACLNPPDGADKYTLGYRASNEDVLALLQAGAEVNAVNRYGFTPLMCLLAGMGPTNLKENTEIVRVFLAHHADVNAVTNNGTTPLSLAKTPEIRQMLLDAGADVELARSRAPHPLAFEVRMGNVQGVQKQLAASRKELENPSLLVDAATMGDPAILTLLLRAGIDTHDEQTNELAIIAAIDSPEMLQVLRQAGIKPTRNLIFSAATRHADWIAPLHAMGGDFTQLDSNGLMTPIEYAIGANNQASVMAILALGISLKGNEGAMFSAAGASPEMLRFLLAHGMDVRGQVDMVESAIKAGEFENARVLLTAGAKLPASFDRDSNGKLSDDEMAIGHMQLRIKDYLPATLDASLDVNQDGKTTVDEVALTFVRAGVKPDTAFYEENAMATAMQAAISWAKQQQSTIR